MKFKLPIFFKEKHMNFILFSQQNIKAATKTPHLDEKAY
jgi:hypothetical protein